MDPAAAVDRVDQHLRRAELLIEQSRYEPAQRECELALAVEPRNVAAHSLLAVCRMNLGDTASAHALARRTIELAPDRAEGYFRHAWTILRDPKYVDPTAYGHGATDPDRRRYIAAGRLLDDAIRINPRQPIFWNLRSLTLRMLGDADLALVAADRGLEIAPRDVDLLERRAVALVALGRILEATTATRQALAIDPQHATSLHRLGQLLHREGRYHGALHALVSAIRLDPTNPTLRIQLFEAMQTQGRFFRLAYRIHSMKRRGPVSLETWAFVLGIALPFVANPAYEYGRSHFTWRPAQLVLVSIVTIVLAMPLAIYWLRHVSRFVLSFHREARYLLPVAQRVPSHFVTFVVPAVIVLCATAELEAIPLVVFASTLPIAVATAQVTRRARLGFSAYAITFIVAMSLIVSVSPPKEFTFGWAMLACFAAAMAPMVVVTLLARAGKLS